MHSVLSPLFHKLSLFIYEIVDLKLSEVHKHKKCGDKSYSIILILKQF